MASFVLAGLSVAHPQPNSAIPPTTQAAAPNSAYTSFISPTGTVTSYDGQISSIARFSKRDDPPSGGHDWDDVAGKGIGAIPPVIGTIIDGIFRHDDDDDDGPRTEFVTITKEPEETSPPGETVTNTITQKPGETTTSTADESVTTTTTTVGSPPGATETVMIPHKEGCYIANPDGSLGVGEC